MLLHVLVNLQHTLRILLTLLLLALNHNVWMAPLKKLHHPRFCSVVNSCILHKL
jgi:hypothetical protein